MKRNCERFVKMLPGLFFCALFFSFSTVFAQTTIELTSDRDNTLYENPTGGISNGAGQHLFTGKTGNLGGGAIRRTLLHFDIVSAIPSGAIIQTASLTLNLSKEPFGAGNEMHMLHPVQADWGEGTSDALGQEGSGTTSTNGDATWIHTFFPLSFWAVQGGDVNMALTTNKSVGGLGFHTWGPSTQMTSDVQGWLDNPTSNFGWLLMGNEVTMTTSKRFDSRENPIDANRPKLTVTYTVPGVSCCMGFVGDANMSHEVTGEISVGDVGAIVNMLFGTGEVPAGQQWCFDEADANLTAANAGHETTIADISVGDIGDIVDHLFGSGDLLPLCP